MSKSLGNVILPQAIADKNGADIFRLWVASSDFTEDLRMGNDIIQSNADAYRRLRNTIRFMLANLAGFDESRARRATTRCRSSSASCSPSWRSSMRVVRDGYTALRFQPRLHTRCSRSAPTSCRRSISTSARTRSIATPSRSPRRRAARTVIDEIFRRVVTWLAPILCFTMEEAWLLRFPGETRACICSCSRRRRRRGTTTALVEKWNRIRALRRVVTGALEIARRDKVIGASLEARTADHP